MGDSVHAGACRGGKPRSTGSLLMKTLIILSWVFDLCLDIAGYHFCSEEVGRNLRSRAKISKSYKCAESALLCLVSSLVIRYQQLEMKSRRSRGTPTSQTPV